MSKKPNSPTFPLFLVCLLGGALSCATTSSTGETEEESPAAAASSEPPAQQSDDLAWWRKSQETRDQRIGWFRDARFGMFVHWGVYSTLGGVWQGQPVKGYAEHIQRIAKIPGDIYKDNVASHFNPTEFNADEWMTTVKNTGMRYFIITAKHHDGFAMWDSAVSDYNVVKATPFKRDPMRELRDAAKKQGIHFGFYYSQAWDWQAAGGPGEGWKYPPSKGEKNLADDVRWMEQAIEPAAKIRKYVDGKVIPQLKELVAKYEPEIFWFDTPSFLPVSENLRILKAVREAAPNVVVNGRITQGTTNGPAARYGDYISTTDKPADFPPVDGDWEGIPTTNESYAWHKEDNTHKPPEHFIGLVARAAARGGNILLNIGPMGTGKMDPKDLHILEGIGGWMKVNGDSIHGTTKSGLPVQAWGDTTRKGSTLYLHVMNWPRKGKIVIGGLKSNVKKATLLADPKQKPLKTSRAGALDVVVQGPEAAPDATDTVVAVELDGEPSADKIRAISADTTEDTMRVFDASISAGMKFGSGKVKDAYVEGWTKPDQSVSWQLRARDKATYDVSAVFDAEAKSAGGNFQVKLGSKTLPGTVVAGVAKVVSVGQIEVEPGRLELAVEPVKIAGPELMKLRGVILTLQGAEPAKPAKPAKAAKGGKKKHK
ncbi:MAG TPA: alpha-L-fucosidase [Polyangia bacterium]|nr:alpha-L-fucosidase [Polyangia bacterium]